jgi:outer membrane immunogenic protein
MRKAVLAAAGAFALASAAVTTQASAADYGYTPGPAPFVPTWQGFYLGGHVGLGEAETNARMSLDYDEFEGDGASGTFRSSLTPDGVIGGAQVGYNWQFSSLIFGLEGDVSFADWSQSSTLFDGELNAFGIDGDGLAKVKSNVDMLATFRGRLGMAFDNWMVYGTGGVAWADASIRGRAELDGESVWSDKESFNEMGYVAGGGITWMAIPQTFSVGLEGLYYWFDESKTLFKGDPIVLAEGELDVSAKASIDDAWVVRVRGDFHF